MQTLIVVLYDDLPVGRDNVLAAGAGHQVADAVARPLERVVVRPRQQVVGECGLGTADGYPDEPLPDLEGDLVQTQLGSWQLLAAPDVRSRRAGVRPAEDQAW